MSNHRASRPSSSTPSDAGYFYHATNEERAQEIVEAGKRVPHGPRWGTDQSTWPDGGTEKRSYFSPRAGAVWSFAPEEGQPVILRVPRSAAQFRNEGTGDVFVRKSIPAIHLEILTEDGWQPLTKEYV